MPAKAVCRYHMENSLGPDQAQHNVGPDLDPNSLTLMIILKEYFKNSIFEKEKSANDIKHAK